MQPPNAAPSLLDHLDAPVVVADPEGKVVFLNPAFAYAFAITRERGPGRALAEFFEGGDREAVLSSVAAACSRGQSVRFRIRHGDLGYQALASPIAVDGERVGALLLLTEELLEMETLHRIQRELHRSLGRLDECAAALARPDAELDAVERAGWATGARGALAEARRAVRNLDRMAAGRERHREREAFLDTARVARDAVAGVSLEMADAGIAVDVLTASDLPTVRGDAKRLQEALEALLRARLAQAPAWLALSVRRGEGEEDDRLHVVLTDPVTERPGPAAPAAVATLVESLGGRLHARPPEDGRRTTVIDLPAG